MRSLVHRLVGRVPATWRRALKRMPGASRLRDRLYGMPQGPDPVPGELRPVVYLPTWLRWDHMPQRPQFILEALSRAGHDVWMVDPTLTTTRAVNDRTTLVGSVRPVPRRGVILYTHFAPLVTQIDKFEDRAVIYDLLDDLAIYDEDEVGLPEERRVRHHHNEMVSRADVVLVSNRILAERHRGERPDLIMVENGVDRVKFQTEGPVAPEVAGLTNVVGYHGAIAQWFDFELMTGLAELAPDLTFVLVGPVDGRVELQMAQLRSLPNVVHFPEQPGELIPTFVRGFSVGLVPFVINHMTEGVTPLKMYEYMACGIPVVATPLPACVEHPAVLTGGTPELIAEHVRAGLGLPASERAELVRMAREASWDQRIVPLLKRLEDLDLLRLAAVRSG